MAPPIRIEWLDGGDAIDLVQALAVRGLVGKPVLEDGRHAIVVHDPHEELDRLVADLVEALGAWLADRGRASLDVRVEGKRRRVAPGAALTDALGRRLPGGRSAAAPPPRL